MQNQIRLSWQQIASPVVSELLCLNSLNGVVLDTEHGFFSNETLVSCIQVIKLSSKKCFVRLSTATTDKIRICLDSGADGIIFSTVESVARAKNLISKCNFPSRGGKRGLGLVRQNSWGNKKLISDPPILIAQIETVAGVGILDALSKLRFDYFMLGPYDLSSSLGKPGDFDDPGYLSSISRFSNLIDPKRRAVHIPNNVRKEIKKYDNFGIIAIGMDTLSILEKMREYERC